MNQLFFDFAKVTEKLPSIMLRAQVDTDLIERLDSRIKDVTKTLKEAKPHG